MKKLLLFALAVFCVSARPLNAQTVDKLRLTYDEAEITAKQVGMTVSNDGKLAAFAYSNTLIKVVNLRNGKTLIKFYNSVASLFEMRFNYNGTKLICTGDNINVAVFDVETGKLLETLQVKASITKVAVSKIKDYVAIGQNGANILVYDLTAKKPVLDLDLNKHHISAIDFNPVKNEIAVARVHFSRRWFFTDKENVQIYNLDDGSVVKAFGAIKAQSIAYDKTGTKLFVCGTKRSTIKTVAKNLIALIPVAGWIGSYFVPVFNNIVEYYDATDDQIKPLISKSKFNPNSSFTSICVGPTYFLCSQEGKSFDVIDFDTKKKIYTTENDVPFTFRFNFSRLGVGITRIYPLADGKHYLINSFDNNICQIYNIEKNQISAYIYSDANDDFVVVGRDGRMDGGQDAISKLSWSEKNSKKRIPIESTFDQFFTPGLLASMLKGEKLEEIKLDIANLKPLPAMQFINPVIDSINFRGTAKVSLETNTAAFKLEFGSTDLGGGITEVKVLQNGKLIYTHKENIHEANKQLKTAVDLNLTPGDNTIKIVAVNDDKSESSSTTIIKYTGVSNEPSKLYILAIGINKYEKSSYDLNFAVPDATGFTESLKTASKDLFAETNVTLLTDAQATKKNILAEVNKIKAVIKQGDVFVFYYAGHGTMTIPKQGEQAVFHLVPHDITNFYNNEMVKEKGISSAELQTISKDIKAQKQLFIFDACQSGGAVEAMASTRGALNEKEMAMLARSTGTYFLTASASDQLAGEFASLGHGVFTYAILQAFTGKADGVNGDTKVSVKELSLYVENAVPDLSEKFKGQKQFPVSYGYGQDFPLVVSNVYKMKDLGTSIGKYSQFTLEELIKMKKAAVEAEDYDKAKELKEEIEKRK